MMLKQMLAGALICSLAVATVGCDTNTEELPTAKPIDLNTDPDVQEALARQAAGEELTSRQRRILEDVEEAAKMPPPAQ